MTRRLSCLAIAAIILATGLAFAWTAPTGAQNESTGGPEATIAALETSIAEQSTQIAVLKVQPPSTPPAASSGISTPMLNTKPIKISKTFVVLYYYFAEYEKDTYIFGEIQNISSAPAIAPAVVFDLLDDKGNSYGTQSALPMYGWVPAKGRMAFQAGSVLGGSLRLGDWASEKVSAGEQYGNLSDLDTSKLAVEGVPETGSLETYSEQEGTIRNTGSSSIGKVYVETLIYDAQGYFAGACTGMSGANIPPGKTLRFTVSGSCGFFLRRHRRNETWRPIRRGHEYRRSLHLPRRPGDQPVINWCSP